MSGRWKLSLPDDHHLGLPDRAQSGSTTNINAPALISAQHRYSSPYPYAVCPVNSLIGTTVNLM
jgi:hypothetical protein